jgi:hypothetical protein
LRSIGRLSAEEKQRVRDILDAELMQAAEKPSATSPNISNPPPAPGFGWAREFLVIQRDFDAPLEDFQDCMGASCSTRMFFCGSPRGMRETLAES